MYEGWLKMNFHDTSQRLVNLQKKGTPYVFEGEWVPRGDQKAYEPTALFTVKDERQGRWRSRARFLTPAI